MLEHFVFGQFIRSGNRKTKDLIQSLVSLIVAFMTPINNGCRTQISVTVGRTEKAIGVYFRMPDKVFY